MTTNQTKKKIVSFLKKNDYEPLIEKMKGGLPEISNPCATDSGGVSSSADISLYGGDIPTYVLPERYREFRRRGIRPVAGDLFLTSQRKGILYLLLLKALYAKRQDSTEHVRAFEIGYLGDDLEVDSLDSFRDRINQVLAKPDDVIEWAPLTDKNEKFAKLLEEAAKFASGSSISDADVNLASQFQDKNTRRIAVEIKKTNGILARDLKRKIAKTAEHKRIVAGLLDKGLLAQEYVVICTNNSSQICRVKSKDAIQAMEEQDVRCSCGRSIGEERVEELVTPTADLQRMLDKSYWMTLLLVEGLKRLDVSLDKVVVNIIDETGETDAMVDVDGHSYYSN